jgi:hypothetical protein
MSPDVAALVVPAVAALAVPLAAPDLDVSEQDVEEPVAAVERVVFDDAGCEVVDNEPRPVVPRPTVPSPPVPRPAMLGLGPAVSEEFAIVVPELDDAEEDDEEAVALDVVTVLEFAELMTPELLTELHGADVLVPALEAPSRPDMLKLGERLTPPPSKVGSAAVPGFSLEQGAVFTVPKSGLVALCGAAVNPLKPVPSGEVEPMPPGVPGLVCAVLWPAPRAVVAIIIAAARRDFIPSPLSVSIFRP